MNALAPNRFENLQIWLKELKEFQLDNMFDTNVLGRAFLYTKSVSVLDTTEQSIEAQIREKNYIVKLFDKEGDIFGQCSCPFDGPCKHQAAVLLVVIDR